MEKLDDTKDEKLNKFLEIFDNTEYFNEALYYEDETEKARSPPKLKEIEQRNNSNPNLMHITKVK